MSLKSLGIARESTVQIWNGLRNLQIHIIITYRINVHLHLQYIYESTCIRIRIRKGRKGIRTPHTLQKVSLHVE